MSLLDRASFLNQMERLGRLMRRHWIPIVILFVALAASVWWFVANTIVVTTALVSRGTAVEIVYATGTVEPVVWAKVTTRIKGQIVQRCRCEGKHVKAGDSLARLDDTEAQANLRELRAREEFLKHDFDRQKLLASKGISSEQALQKADSDLRQILAQIAAQVERLDYYNIVAPIDGVVLREDGEVGEIVDSNVILYRIGNQSPLWLVAEVNEEDITRVLVGQSVLLRTDAFPAQQLYGNVQQITPAGDPVAKTYRIRVSLPEDTPLRVGMSVEANIVVRKKDAVLLVPAAALRANSVFVVKGRRTHLRPVSIGVRGTQAVEILSGLDEGEIVISPVLAELGDRVRIRIGGKTNLVVK